MSVGADDDDACSCPDGCHDHHQPRRVIFDVGQVLVAGDHRGGVEGVGVDAGAQYVDAVEGGFGGDAVEVTLETEVGVGDLAPEVLAHLVFPDGRTDRFADLAGPAQGARGDPPGDRGQ